jgi:hypothetical protein
MTAEYQKQSDVTFNRIANTMVPDFDTGVAFGNNVITVCYVKAA